MVNAEDSAAGLGMYLIIHWALPEKNYYIPRGKYSSMCVRGNLRKYVFKSFQKFILLGALFNLYKLYFLGLGVG